MGMKTTFINLLGDLRFVIGVFFAIISLILILTGLFSGSRTPEGLNLNLISGSFIVCFSVFMLASSWFGRKK
jgi:hypothetical protein